MVEEVNTLNQDLEAQSPTDRDRKQEEVLEALRRLRGIGEKLPAVDAVAVVREGRSLPRQGAR
ncbi:MAG: hypothetical protein WKF84_24465 [Pyrinomonadaceae bacterium]